ncbi:MAG: glutathione S-transferase family protein [Myxococcota bacterium]
MSVVGSRDARKEDDVVQLLREDIQTHEVLDWQGIHLLHYVGSTCSQETRIFLNLKGIEWVSHRVDLARHENYTAWFMGINPRGLVPVLVDDGQVIIESNDILEYLEAKFPAPRLIPDGQGSTSHALLAAEDALHLDLRALSLRYVFGQSKTMRSEDVLERYEHSGSGTVGGQSDPYKAVELEFFRSMQRNNGITDEQVRTSAAKFRAAYDELEVRLASGAQLLGDEVSLVDIAWYVYSARLRLAGYPLHPLHPRVGAWFDALNARSEFAKEVKEPSFLLEMREQMHVAQDAEGSSLRKVTGW